MRCASECTLRRPGHMRTAVFILLVAALAMLLVSVYGPEHVSEQDGPSEGICGENLSWNLSGAEKTKTLTITGSGMMYDYYKNTAPWQQSADAITSLTLPEQMINVGNYAFYNCSNLGTVTFSGTTSLRVIGDYAFYNCKSLKGNLSLPESLTSIGEYSFFHAYKNTDEYGLSIGSRMTSIGNHAFDGCSGFSRSLQIPDSVTYIGSYAFNGCTNFETLTLSKSITSVENYAFQNCNFVGDLTIPSSVTSIGNSQFYNNAKYAGRLTIPDSVTTIGDSAFHQCKFSGRLTIPDSVTSVGSYQFYGCSGFNGALTLPDGLTSVGSYQFYGCSGLTGALTLPNTIDSIDEQAFFGCSGLDGTLTLPDGLITVGSYQFQNCTKLSGALTLPDGLTSVGNYQFYGCTGFRGALTIPDSVTLVGNYQFYSCGCDETLRLSSNLEHIGSNQFYNYLGKIEQLIIPSSITFIGESAFSYDSSHTMRISKLVVLSGGSNISANSFENHRFLDEHGAEITVGSNEFIGFVFDADGDTANMHRSGKTTQISVTYKTDDGSEEPPTQGDMVPGETFVVKSYNGTKSGQVFAGWSYLSEVYQPGDTITAGSDNIVLNAIWSNTYKVQYYQEGGSGSVPEPKYYETGDVITIPFYRGTKDGYEFGGWSYDGKIYNTGAKITIGNSNVDLVAIWLQFHEVTYDTNGGTGPAPTESKIREGHVFQIKHYEGEKEGFVFSGWLYGGLLYVEGNEIVMGTEDVILLASWTKNHSVRYDINGGTGPTPTQPDVPEGEVFTVQKCEATKTGYRFSYWEYNYDHYVQGSIITMGLDDIVLKAVWTKGNETHSVTYDLNGGQGTPPKQADVEEGKEFALKHCDAVKIGYVFSGWQYKGKIYQPDERIKMGTEDIKLVAMWEPESEATKDYKFLSLLVIIGAVVIASLVVVANVRSRR